MSLATADLIVKAAVILHNLIRNNCHGSGHEEYESDVATNSEKINMIPLPRSGGFASAEGFAVRDAFKGFF